MIIAFFVSVLAFFPTWFFCTMTANLVGIDGPEAGLVGFVAALVIMFLFARFLYRLARPPREHVEQRRIERDLRRRF